MTPRSDPPSAAPAKSASPEETSPASASESPELPATIGRYEIVRLVGEGAMGRVLLAHDPVLDRDVAVKLLRDDLRIPREVREGLLVRMRHEARAAARVAHPNLVTLHDMGEDARAGLYLVFEYVRGPTLKSRVLEGPLAPAEVATLARELGGALSSAHDAGIVHRDIKPENVMLAATGAKIADFGIARIPDSTLTHAGGLFGTPAYGAPETFRGGSFSPKSDQFSLATTLYEALAAERAFPGDDAVAVTAAIAHETAPPIAAGLGLSPAVDEVLARAMAKSPADRYPSCEVFGRALAAALDSARARAATPTDATATAPPRPERKTGQVLLGAAVVVATALLIARTAVRSAESADAADTVEPGTAPAGSASAVASATKKPAASASARPRPRSVPTAHASGEPRATPPDAIDGGAAAIGSATAGPASSAAPAVETAHPAPSAVPSATPAASATPATPSRPSAIDAPK